MHLVDFILIPVLSLLPCLLWLFYFWRQDRYDREPFKTMAVTFLLGMFSTVFALIANTIGLSIFSFILGNGVLAQSLGFFLIVGPVEEGCKFLAVYCFAYHRPEFDEPVDGVVYSATSALGFAAAENVLYLSRIGIGIIPYRALLSNPGHALFSAFWGLAMSKAKGLPNLKSRRFPVLVLGWSIAAVMHALFDTILTVGPAIGKLIPIPLFGLAVIIIPVIAIMIGMFAYVKVRINRMVDQSPHKEGTRLLGNFMPCQQCGMLGQSGQFCFQCGSQIAAPTDQRFCPICGTQQRLGASFCKKCGQTLVLPVTSSDRMSQPHFLSLDSNGHEEVACVVNEIFMRVGKTLDNNFVIDHPTVSKQHAQIYWHNSQQYFIKDLGSTNGTFINGKRIIESALKDGCEVRFGSISFIFKTQYQTHVQQQVPYMA
jgi:RsiW-degrading membrane proteinase PrsW (M82 family)